MPNIGEIRTAKEAGYTSCNHLRIWVRCPQCGTERWVSLYQTKRQGYTGLCHRCNASIRGGNRVKQGYRGKHSDGYIVIKLQPDDFFYPMAGRDGYVLEHRLVIARNLGRCLHSWEIVHHKGTKYPKGSRENRSDNRVDNLQLVSDDKHKQISILEAKIVRLQKKNDELKAENRRLTNVKTK